MFKSKSDARLKSWFKIWPVVGKLIRNLTRRKSFISKSDMTKKFNSKFDKTKKIELKVMLFTKTFSFKIMLFKNNFFPKSCILKKFFLQNHATRKNFFFKFVLFKIGRKPQISRILRGKNNQNVIFWVQKVFQNLLFKNISSSKNVLFKNTFFIKILLFNTVKFFKIWRVVNILNENLTRRKNFNSKSDAL